MKILTRNSDHVVIYAGDDLFLTASEAGGDGWRDPHFTSSNATLNDAELPPNFYGACYTFTGGVWSVAPGAQPNIDAFLLDNQAALTPKSISPRQIRQALTRAGLRTSVEAAIDAGGQDIKDWYAYSTVFERNRVQVTEMALALGVPERQLDDLWILGASL